MSPASAAGANPIPSGADVSSRPELQEHARAVLRQLAAHPDEILSTDSTKVLVPLAADLAKVQSFNYARQLIAWARLAPSGSEALRRRLGQKHALYTYKDTDLPVFARLQRALELLGEIEDLSSTTDQETLGLAGAIYKRLWDLDGRPETLERSSRCYLRGFEAGERRGRGSLPDDGYTGINAAFVLDLLAAEEEREAAGDKETTEYVGARRTKAEAIRRTIVSGLSSRVGAPISSPVEWWRELTLAEAYFGLGQYDLAREQLRRAATAKALMSPWVYESSARQFASLARLRAAVDGSPDAANAVLTELVGDQDSALRSASIGKVGLALSGGGFRASFFHIGVLAWLAERGVLPAVEVLSCVSGGSILGAQYYLMARDLLQRRRDREVTEQDYVDLVEQLHREFLAGVQRNVRTRALAELSTSLRMIVQPHYTRTRRLGELYEKLLYARVQDGGGTQERWLDSLFINPPDTSGFSPPRDNWMRSTKVPILVVNATTLNTGHNWQFTASWMGEPPASVDAETDINDRLRRMYYDQAPGRYKRMRLGRAVAASSCVPGLFEPIAFPRLYPDRTVTLVDGGVHDNQGAASLLDQDCTVLLISDASGQMKTESKPGGDALSVLKRSNDVLMARVRGAQYRDLATRRSASLLRGLMFLHLKKDLDVTPVEWVDSDEPIDPDDTRVRSQRGNVTSYGVSKRIQGLVAAIRTDLDSFSDAEANALMLSGYQMAAHEFESCVSTFPAPRTSVKAPAWSFLRLREAMAVEDPERQPESARLARVLRASSHIVFKVWRLPSLASVSTLIAVLAIAGLVVWQLRSLGVVTWPGLLAIARWVGLAVVALGLWATARALVFRESVRQALTGVYLGAFGVLLWPVNRLHLHLFDRFYLQQGQLDRIVPPTRGGGPPAGTSARVGEDTRAVQR